MKQQVKDRLSPKLADRIDLNSAGYRWHHEADGRIWLTVDGEEVVNFCTHTHWNEAKEIADDLVEHNLETTLQPLLHPFLHLVRSELGMLARGD